jgi:hypothetical protein
MSYDFVAGDLLYHAVHGLCRVSETSKSADKDGKETVNYTLVPHIAKSGNQRFAFGAHDLEVSGFHTLVSKAEAQAILDSFRKGRIVNVSDQGKVKPPSSFSSDVQTWALAEVLLSCAHDTVAAKDLRKRRTLERAARGLICEFAHVFEVPAREAANQVRKSLECSRKLDPLVLAAINNADKS